MFIDSSVSSSGNATEGVDGQGVSEFEWAEEVMRAEAEGMVECEVIAEVVEGGSEEPGEKGKRPPGENSFFYYFTVLFFNMFFEFRYF